MRSPLGQLLCDLLSPEVKLDTRREAWRTVETRLPQLAAEYLVELELRGYSSLASRIERRVATARQAIESEDERLQTDFLADDLTVYTVREVQLLVEATDRRLDSTNDAGFDRGAVGAFRAQTPDAASRGLDESDGQTDIPPLTAAEVAVIRTLVGFDSSRLFSGAAIEEAMKGPNRLGSRTINQAVIRLIELGLAERPRGARSGARLTRAGRRHAAKIAD